MSSLKVDEFSLWKEPKLRAYIGEVRRKFGVVDTLALPSLRDLPSVKIETLFVPPLLCRNPVHADDNPDDWPEGKNLLSELQNEGQLVVLGDPGGGKTTLSNWLAWRLTSGTSAPLPSRLENKLPFPCILRDMPDDCFELDFSLSDLAVAIVEKLLGETRAELLEPLIRDWVFSGNYVLILDGVDEVAIDRRKLIASWMREASRQDAVVLATSRVVGYEDYPIDSEIILSDKASVELTSKIDKSHLNSMLKRGGRPREKSSHTSSLVRGHEWAKLRYLMPFNASQVSDFARNWYSQRCVSDVDAKQRTSDLLNSISQSEITQKLSRTPNLLSLMAIVHRERAHLPDGKALLYEEIVNAYINTIDSQRRIGAEISLSSYGWKEKKSWLSYVGFKLQESREWSSSMAGILATEDQVIEWLEEAIQQSGVSEYRSVAVEFLSWVARRSGLLLPRGEGRYAFVHLSFQEYFCSCYLAGCIVRPAFVTGNLPKNSLVTKDKISNWSQHPSWLETYIFLFESLSAEHGSEWVETLVQIVLGTADGALASLAARLVKNKHVKLRPNVRDNLAGMCVSAVFAEAGIKDVPESEIFRILCDVGYAINLSGEKDDVEALKANPEKCEKLLVLLAGGNANLSAELFSKCKNLLAVSISGGEVDLSGFGNKNKINSLRLNGAEVCNFAELHRLKHLEILELQELSESDLSSLANLKKIKVLEINGLPAKDLSPLSGLQKISYLHVSNIPACDFSPIGKIKKLNSLFISKVPIRSVDFLGDLRFLDYLSLADLGVKELDSIVFCNKLTTVSVKGCGGIDLAALASLPKLEFVFLSQMDFIDIDPLGKSKSMVVLMLSQVGISSFNALADCSRMTNLHCSNIKIKDIDSISKLKNLQVLVLRKVPNVKDISFITGLRKLRYLSLFDLEVKDVSILEGVVTPFTLVLSPEHEIDLGSLASKGDFTLLIDSSEVDG